MSSYDKYYLYKIKYLNLKKIMNGGDIEISNQSNNNSLIYEKKIINLPIEYLQNILYIVISTSNIDIKDVNINFVIDKEKKYITILINAVNNKIIDKKEYLINLLDKRLEKYTVN